MATTTSKKKNTPKTIQEQAPAVDIKRQLRLAFGILFLLCGIFICLAIISYVFTWKTDQDKLLAAGGLQNFLIHGGSVANWTGRLGATLAHLFVYRGAVLLQL